MCYWKTIPHSESGLRAVQAQLTMNKLTHRYLRGGHARNRQDSHHIYIYIIYVYIRVHHKCPDIRISPVPNFILFVIWNKYLFLKMEIFLYFFKRPFRTSISISLNIEIYIKNRSIRISFLAKSCFIVWLYIDIIFFLFIFYWYNKINNSNSSHTFF